jgi:hypothetical protein
MSDYDLRKETLTNLINKAIAEYNDAKDLEEENDYSDALESMERKYLEGYADGLAHAYHIAFGETNV